MIFILETRNLKQLITVPTHKKGHTLDWLIVETNMNIFDICVNNYCFSDHFVISFELDSSIPKREKRTVVSRNLKCID